MVHQVISDILQGKLHVNILNVWLHYDVLNILFSFKWQCLFCIFAKTQFFLVFLLFSTFIIYFSYYAPPLWPEGPRRCPDRGIIIFSPVVMVTICTRSLYLAENWCRQSKIHRSHSTVESLSYWVCIYGRKIHDGKLGSSHNTVESLSYWVISG